AHDPECNESNMCDPEDELWLDHFYSRIMNQTDPLAKYHQTRSKTKASPVHTHSIPSDINHDKSISKPKQHYWGIVCYVIIVLIFFIWLLNR
ncbi:MAG: hypothetical protein IKW04_01560, partial [Clostridia bacterium]|nr:hypothetical protein [Clostridia bacterium]